GQGEEAFRLMAEAIRMIPDRPVNAAEFDPQIKALYKRVKDELTRQGPGTLAVQVDDANAVAFLRERYAGTGAGTLHGLLRGIYRVLGTRGDHAGRIHEVEVPARGRATVDVSWSIDSVLRTRAGYVGLETRGSDGGESVANLAVKLGRA